MQRKSKIEDSKNLTRGEELGAVLDSLLAARPATRLSFAFASRVHNRAPKPPRPEDSRREIGAGIVLLVLVTVGILAVPYGANLLSGVSGPHCASSHVLAKDPAAQRSIALIDGLSSDYQDPQFVQDVNVSSVKAGFHFNYFPSGRATVDFFSNLPNEGYSMIILRTHGAGINLKDPSVIATSSPYSGSQRIGDQLTHKLASLDVNGTRWFAITSDFVAQDMCGRFPGTLIVAMFCTNPFYTPLAEAFIAKGAAAYVGWLGPVTIGHSDSSFDFLLSLLLQGSTIGGAVRQTMSAIGPDPIWGSHMTYYLGTTNSTAFQK